jgi:16S rRNA (uracil1498-N3)-methyltransferase
MNLILLFEDDFIDNKRVVLKGRRMDHLTSVLAVKEGDELTVGVLNGKIGKAKVIKLGSIIELDVTLSQNAPKVLPLTLLVPMIRPPMFKRLLFHATTLGIKKIIVLNFNRVEKSLWNSSSLRPEEIKEQLVLGLEQAKDTVLPEVILRDKFKPFVEDELPALAKGHINLVAHPGGKACPDKVKKPINVVIGPEGGIIPYELEQLMKAGFKAVELGPRILRVDTALPYIIGKLF